MATSSVKKNDTNTLVASTVDTVNLTQSWDAIEISNQGSSPIYVSQSGTDPTVAGDNFDIVEAGVTKLLSPVLVGGFTNGTNNHVIKLISAGTPQYTVSGVARSNYGG